MAKATKERFGRVSAEPPDSPSDPVAIFNEKLLSKFYDARNALDGALEDLRDELDRIEVKSARDAVASFEKEFTRGVDKMLRRVESIFESIDERLHMVSITPGMAHAAPKKVKFTCKGCGLMVPQYRGRYPKVCPTCGGELMSAEKAEAHVGYQFVHVPISCDSTAEARQVYGVLKAAKLRNMAVHDPKGSDTVEVGLAMLPSDRLAGDEMVKQIKDALGAAGITLEANALQVAGRTDERVGREMKTIHAGRSSSSKFSSKVDEWLYEQSMDGPDEELGSAQDFGWYGLLRFKDGVKVIESKGSTWTFYAAILTEDNSGFVSSRTFDSIREADKVWSKLEGEYSDWAEEFPEAVQEAKFSGVPWMRFYLYCDKAEARKIREVLKGSSRTRNWLVYDEPEGLAIEIMPSGSLRSINADSWAETIAAVLSAAGVEITESQIRAAQMSPAKFEIGDQVSVMYQGEVLYSGKVTHIRYSRDPEYPHKYRVQGKYWNEGSLVKEATDEKKSGLGEVQSGRQILINTSDDMEWLRDVHLQGLSTKYRSAILYGNEDAPDQIDVYTSRDPKVTEKPRIFLPDAHGDFVVESVKEKATTATTKCPVCGTKVLVATGYCVKCKKKTIKKKAKKKEAYSSFSGYVDWEDVQRVMWDDGWTKGEIEELGNELGSTMHLRLEDLGLVKLSDVESAFLVVAGMSSSIKAMLRQLQRNAQEAQAPVESLLDDVLSKHGESRVAEIRDDEVDETGGTELELFIQNDGNLYRQQYQPINKNLMTKIGQGRYDRRLAVKLFMYLVDEGAKRYVKEFGAGPPRGMAWHEMFPKATRLWVAERLRDQFEVEASLGNYNHLLPKKYQDDPEVLDRISKLGESSEGNNEVCEDKDQLLKTLASRLVTSYVVGDVSGVRAIKKAMQRLDPREWKRAAMAFGDLSDPAQRDDVLTKAKEYWSSLTIDQQMDAMDLVESAEGESQARKEELAERRDEVATMYADYEELEKALNNVAVALRDAYGLAEHALDMHKTGKDLMDLMNRLGALRKRMKPPQPRGEARERKDEAAFDLGRSEYSDRRTGLLMRLMWSGGGEYLYTVTDKNRVLKGFLSRFEDDPDDPGGEQPWKAFNIEFVPGGPPKRGDRMTAFYRRQGGLDAALKFLSRQEDAAEHGGQERRDEDLPDNFLIPGTPVPKPGAEPDEDYKELTIYGYVYDLMRWVKSNVNLFQEPRSGYDDVKQKRVLHLIVHKDDVEKVKKRAKQIGLML